MLNQASFYFMASASDAIRASTLGKACLAWQWGADFGHKPNRNQPNICYNHCYKDSVNTLRTTLEYFKWFCTYRRHSYAAIVAIGSFVSLGGTALGVPHDKLFESVRGYSRGGTGVAAFDSYEATRINPATLVERDVTFQFRPLEIDIFSGFDGRSQVGALTGDTTSDNQSLIDTASDLAGTNVNGRAQFGLLAMRFGGFEVAPFLVAEGQADLRNPAIPEADFHVSTTAGANITYSFATAKTLSWGITVRPLHRWWVGQPMGVVDLLDNSEFGQDIAVLSGWGIGLDLGMIYTPVKTFRLGVTIQNLGDTEYFQDFGSEPPGIKQTLNTGVLQRFEVFGGNLDLLADIQGLLNRDGGSYIRLLHLGIEQGWRVFFPKNGDHDYGVVAGINEGYFCTGFFVDLYIFRFDYANYGVELGHNAGQRPDRRESYALRTAMTF